MDTLLQDIRYAFRRLRKSPGFSAVVMLTLALGIGANTGIFSVVNTVLLRPLPYKEPERLTTLFHFYPVLNNLEAPVSAPGFKDYQARPFFESAAVETGWGPTVTGSGDPQRLTGSIVSGDYFTVLGVPAMIGRPLRRDEDEPGKNKVVVLSYGLWQRLYGGDRSVVSGGRKMILNDEPFEIVGVMPPHFRDFWNRPAEIWSPLALPPEAFARNRGNEFLNFIGRLKTGVSHETARKEMTAYAQQLKRDFPNLFGGAWSLKTKPLADQAIGGIKPSLYRLLWAVGFVLLIACANVANLMLVRAAARQKEVVIRTALGAQRGQLIRQLLVESVLLGVCGGALGLGLAQLGVRALIAINPTSLPRADEISIDTNVLLFTLVIAVVTGVLFGLVPALQTARPDLNETLKEGGRGSSAARAGTRVRQGLVIAQTALALVLLVGAGLLMKSFAAINDIDPGFRADHLLTFNLALPPTKYRSDTAVRAFFDEAIPRLEAVPGVKAVGATSVMPFSGGWSTASFTVEGYQPPPNQPGPWGDFRVATPKFFETMNIKVLTGRTFDARDILGAPSVVVVDDEFARRFWPGANAVGKRITFNRLTDTAITWIEIIGVVAHTKHEALDADARVQYYFPYAQRTQRRMSIAVRTAVAPLSLTPALRQAVQSIDKDQPLARVQAMESMIGDSVGPRRLKMVLIEVFAAVALVLASLGIYGVISYTVALRTQEMGIRMALGASQRTVLELVLEQGMTLVLIGVGLGVAGALLLTVFIRSELYGVTPRDISTFLLVPSVLAVVALFATLVPAIRATRVDPLTALRPD